MIHTDDKLYPDTILIQPLVFSLTVDYMIAKQNGSIKKSRNLEFKLNDKYFLYYIQHDTIF